MCIDNEYKRLKKKKTKVYYSNIISRGGYIMKMISVTTRVPENPALSCNGGDYEEG